MISKILSHSDNELWREIPGFENYQASTLGRVRNSKGKVLKPRYDRYGYLRLTLRKDNKLYTRFVHRLIAITFYGDSNLEVNHCSGLKNMNNLINLEFVTHKENVQHAIRNGLIKNNKCKCKPIKVFDKINQKLYQFKSMYKAAQTLGYASNYFNKRVANNQFENTKYRWELI